MLKAKQKYYLVWKAVPVKICLEKRHVNYAYYALPPFPPESASQAVELTKSTFYLW